MIRNVMTLVAVVSLGLVWSQSYAGAEFSISASPTDPFVNTSAATDSLRHLYLWATCIDDGISAFEGDVTGSLNVAGFWEENGVINIGSGSELLLAVPGCPFGSEVNFLLGSFLVWDSGGSLCLGPSAANGRIVAVDCAGGGTEDPKVLGFDSDGGVPCDVGENACEPQSGASHGSFGT
jgi:hypothetical protein